MVNKPPHRSVYSFIHKIPHLDDEELTTDFNVTDADELPPMPSSIPSGRSFDPLGTLSELNHQDAFRALHEQPVDPDPSVQIAVSSRSVNDESVSTPWVIGAPDPQASSESLSIQFTQSSASPPDVSSPESDISLGSRQSLLTNDEAECSEDDAVSGTQLGTSAKSSKEVLWQTQEPLLALRNITLMYGDRLLVRELDLDIGSTGLYIIVCAESFCRRLLPMMLAGVIKGATVRLEGSVLFAGEKLGTKSHPQLCTISASELLMTLREFFGHGQEDDITTRIPKLLSGTGLEHLSQQMHECIHGLDTYARRAVALIRAALGTSPLLCLDDPLDGLTDEPLHSLVSLVHRISATRAVLIMESEPGPFLTMARGVAYYQDGRIVTQSNPQGVVTSSSRKALGSLAEPLSPTTVPAPQQIPAPSMSVHSVPISEQELEQPHLTPRPTANGQQGPRGFRWLVPGSLAGTPEPGLLFDIDYDLALLKGAGITMLVTLTEQPLPESLLESHGLKSLFFPIVDMNVPSCRATEDLCALVEMALERGEVIAFHCKAGLGRTGTLLVSYLIWEGAPPAEALQVARSIEPGWVQSPIQEQYLFEFAQYCQRKTQTLL